MLFIGITGGVGTGKSEVMRILAEHKDARVLLADEVAHLLMEPGQVCYDKILQTFADDNVDGALLQEDKNFCKEALAKLIFFDANKRKQMNEIVHPAVKDYVLKQVQEEKIKGNLTFFFFEAALLLEEHYDAICDELWYIYTDEDIRRERLKITRGYSDEKIDSIFASQHSKEEFEAVCKETVINNGSVLELEALIDKLLEKVRGRIIHE